MASAVRNGFAQPSLLLLPDRLRRRTPTPHALAPWAVHRAVALFDVRVAFALAGPYIPSPHIRRDQLPQQLSPNLGASWLDTSGPAFGGQPVPGLPPSQPYAMVPMPTAQLPGGDEARSGWAAHAHGAAEAGALAPSPWVRPSGPVTSMS